MNHPWKPVVVIQLSILLMILSLFTLGVQSRGNQRPVAYTVPISVQGKQGTPGEVDYEKVKTLVEEEVAKLPKPRNGVDGVSPESIPGKDGKDGSDGKDGPQGPPGDIGPSSQQTEIRINPSTLNLECRLSGDIAWTVVTNVGNVCP